MIINLVRENYLEINYCTINATSKLIFKCCVTSTKQIRATLQRLTMYSEELTAINRFTNKKKCSSFKLKLR